MTFLFNGGPGSASAWLQFGNVGPWRLPFDGDGAVSSASPELPASSAVGFAFAGAGDASTPSFGRKKLVIMERKRWLADAQFWWES